MSNLFKLVGLIAFIAFFIIIGPLLTLWALNTLFPVLAIEYTWQTWVSVIILGAFVRAKVSVKK